MTRPTRTRVRAKEGWAPEDRTVQPIPLSRVRVNGIFLDSGAHSLYTEKVIKTHSTGVEKYNTLLNEMMPAARTAFSKQMASSPLMKKFRKKDYAFYRTKEFWEYVDRYAAFVKKYRAALDYYVNVDAIFNPKISWEVLKYLENEHGLNPVPVIHHGTHMKWVERHIEAGYDLLGIGGLGQEVSPDSYFEWADRLFDLLCSTPDRKPVVRTHGFAITTYSILKKYPWWSVDSTSWAKWAGYGIIYLPHYRKRKGFTFEVNPHMIFVSQESPYKQVGRHVLTLPDSMKRIVMMWLEEIDVPLGSEKEWGIVSANAARIIANLRFFERVIQSLPDWPWPFKLPSRRTCLVDRKWAR